MAPSVVLLAALGLRLAGPPALEEAQLKVFDAFQRLQPRAYRPVPVRIIDLDDESLAKLGQWPWPRTQVARLVERLAELGAAVIAFDVVFAEPDRTSPARILPLWLSPAEIEALSPQLGELPDHDQALARAIGSASVVTGFALTTEANAGEPALKAGFAHAGDKPHAYLADFAGAVVTLPALESAASGNGHFNMLAEQDGIIRRVPLLLRLGETLYPSLVAESLRVAQGASTYLVKSSGGSGEASFGAHTGITHVKIGAFIVPTDAQGRIWLYDTGPVPERSVPAWRLFEKDADHATVEGAIVFLGTSAAGLKDLRTTPLNPVAAGVEVHAQLAEQILLQEFLQRPDWAGGAEVVYLVVLGAGLILLLPRIGPAWCAVLGSAAIGAACWFSWAAFGRLRWLVDPVFPSLVALLIYLVASLISFLRTEAERRQVRHAFSRYMSPVLVNRLAEHPEQLKLGGETKPMTLLFADIRGFTTIAEQFDAQGLTTFINRYLTPMTEIILKQGGTIDKYIGDCIMAFWNAPLDDAQHASHACQAALRMQDYLVRWNAAVEAEAQAKGARHLPIRIGIGINTGECCVGNLGSDQRFDYSVLGDAVNLASRLEGQSKTYGVGIVTGEDTCGQAPDYAALELDLIRVKGKTQPARVFALLGDSAVKAGSAFHDLRARHQEMLAAYRAKRWADARALIGECLRLEIAQTQLAKLYALYTTRLEDCEASPPGAEWDGVFVATSK
ncbi:MAG: adenylate/guanylate cyclase domain-containing protein [Candidatus Omnitrophica bacterium]|nr:adenylate/guanylate cyclase domain-containing protein [Candidatus Omnitrophota bacterium]